jgi:Na+-transporting methylmalonyl-CoA/oxaloacetate decarboxylase gamma subunit
MSFIDSLWVSLLGLAVVFAVLILLSFFLTVLSAALGMFLRNSTTGTAVIRDGNAAMVPQTGGTEVPYIVGGIDGEWSGGELKLIGVDEPTAAMIMAIISDESQIPLSQLRFKMIRAID